MIRRFRMRSCAALLCLWGLIAMRHRAGVRECADQRAIVAGGPQQIDHRQAVAPAQCAHGPFTGMPSLWAPRTLLVEVHVFTPPASIRGSSVHNLWMTGDDLVRDREALIKQGNGSIEGGGHGGIAVQPDRRQEALVPCPGTFPFALRPVRQDYIDRRMIERRQPEHRLARETFRDEVAARLDKIRLEMRV